MPITNRRKEMPEGSEFYPTEDPYATQVLLDHEYFEGNIWECACGSGDMSFVLEDNGYDVLSSDANDHGYGNRVDFLTSKFKADNIVTNPPYLLAEEFVHQALKLAKNKVAFLVRLAFLEGSTRYNEIYSEFPPARIWIFSSRLTFYKKKKGELKAKRGKNGGTTAYAWLIWDRDHEGPTETYWLPPRPKPEKKNGKARKARQIPSRR